MSVLPTKNNPISVRLPDPLRRTLELHLDRTDRTRSRFVRAAIAEKLRRDRQELRASSVMPS